MRRTGITPPLYRPFLPAAPKGRAEWGLALAILLGMLSLAHLIELTMGYQSVPPAFLVFLLLSSLFLSRWPVMLLAFASTMAWWFFILPQRFSLRIHRPEDGLMLALFFLAALVSGHVASLLRAREKWGVEGELTARTLYNLLRELNESRDLDSDGINRVLARIENLFRARVGLMLPEADGESLKPVSPPAPPLSDADMALAIQAWRHHAWTGRETSAGPSSSCTFIPLLSGEHAGGVLTLRLHPRHRLTDFERTLLESIAQLLAQVLERDAVARQARAARLVMDSQKMQRALVDNFSHELQTPLSVMSSIVQHLRLQGPRAPGGDILDEAAIAMERLNLVVSEMIDLAQLESGTLRPSLEWCDTADYLQEWMEGKPADTAARIALKLPPHPIYIRVDARLFNTALDNLLHNALRHGEPGSPVQVEALTLRDQALIRLSNKGPTIPPDQVERIFDRFYRGPNAKPGGLGLGLPIARQFIELCGGTVKAESRPGSGCFTIFLPFALDLPLPKDAAP